MGHVPALIVVVVSVAGIAAAIVALRRGSGEGLRFTAVAGVLLGTLALLNPLFIYSPRLRAVMRGDAIVSVQADDVRVSRGTTREVTAALVWLRDHSRADDVVAVNNAYQTAAEVNEPGADPRYFYYSAIAERRVFLQGWQYSDGADAGRVANPFPGRVELNRRAIQGDPSALQLLASRHRVRFLFIDRRYGPLPRRTPLLQTVFSNGDATIYELEAGTSLTH